MKEYKRLKDPIYGYINIPSFMVEIIDTSNFQRLRRIIQTSYSPLYSSAVHNRFVHSLGVFHLGEIAYKRIISEIKRKEINIDFKIENMGEIFLMSCLLHDIGHAPFSHTGEQFYKEDDDNCNQLHKILKRFVDKKEFNNDIKNLKQKDNASPHEIMSAILGIKNYQKFLGDSDNREFFARCITGYKYSVFNHENSIKNCFISLLNSKVIDVDKLDYLIRDAYITGFDTVNIDYERLLDSLTIIKNNEDDLKDNIEVELYEIAYTKNAISVIENVVYAHDSERKWIQNHPIVLYESYLLQHIMRYLSNTMKSKNKKLFSLEALGTEGVKLKGHQVRLLCDDDIVYLIKNVYPNEICNEYFERSIRRHPIWKSEAEYNAFFLAKTRAGELLTEFEDAMEKTATHLLRSSDSWVINSTMIENIEKEIKKLDSLKNEGLDDYSIRVQKKDKNAILKIMKCLENYSLEKDLDLDFVVIKANQFNSGFDKPDFSDIKIVFEIGTTMNEKPINFTEVVPALTGNRNEKGNFFYIFYKRKEGITLDIDNQELCNKLLNEFIK